MRFVRLGSLSSASFQRFRSAAADALIVLAAGTLGGFLFQLMGLPLAWTLGSLTAAAALALSGARCSLPASLRDLARPVVGVLAGSAFSPEAVLALAAAWHALLYVAAYTFLTSVLGWWFFRRIGRLDPVTAYFAAAPGGLGEMTLLGGMLGGDMRSLVLIHSIRIVAVVFAVPALLQYGLGHSIVGTGAPAALHASGAVWDWFLLIGCGVAGYALGTSMRFPGGVMVAAMLVSAVVHALGFTQLVPPGWVIGVVQVLIGTIAGSRLAGIALRELGNVLAQALIWSGTLMTLAVGSAWLGAWLFGKPLAVLILALAPGGMTEMTVISYALGMEVSFIVLCQISRIFLVTTCAPLLSPAAVGRTRSSQNPPPDRGSE
jgi:membrane AbrB-like protein